MIVKFHCKSQRWPPNNIVKRITLVIQAFAKRASFLRYVDDDYDDSATYVREARRPLHYPPFVLVLRPD